MVRNIQIAREKWDRPKRVLGREGADGQTSGHIYLAVVQLVMLYGSETWVTTLHWEGLGRTPPQGGPQDNRGANLARKGRHMGILPLEAMIA